MPDASVKVLFVPSRTPDTLEDVTFRGLKEIGAEVVDYPYKHLYHAKRVDGLIKVLDRDGNELWSEDEEDGMLHSSLTTPGLKKAPGGSPRRMTVSQTWSSLIQMNLTLSSSARSGPMSARPRGAS